MNGKAHQRQQWRRAAEVFEHAVDLEDEARARYLEQVFRREPGLRAGVEGLLAADARAEGPLERPLEDYAALLDTADLERETAAVPIPRRIGPYRLIRQLGAGGMGVVYEAEDGRLGRRIALKLLADDHELSNPLFQRFEREARALARLNHPHIVTIHSVEESDGKPFFTMELVEGASLARLIPADGLPLEKLLRWSTELAGALAAAHQRGIVHRDLKPGNVMIAADDRVKVLDFGLATRSRATTADQATRSLDTMTEEGMILGTAPYMSPEQAEGKPLDERSDLFSFGTLLYEMASGRRPFDGETRARIMSAILRDRPEPLSKVRGGLPEAFVAVVESCLEKDPERRAHDAGRIHRQLAELHLAHESGAVTAKQRGLRGGWIAAAAALALLVLVLAVQLPKLRRTASGEAAAPTTTSRSARPPSADPRFATRLAVLPFESVGDASDEFFAAGIADEISSRLTSVEGLGVISRKSTSRWAAAEADVVAIGQALDAEYVLEGTVRWSRAEEGVARVRVTPRLVRVADDQQLWSQSYNRRLADVLGLEASIAGQLVTALKVALPGLREPSSQEPASEPLLADRPTDDLDAYFAYLRGMEILSRATLTDADRLEAVGHFEEAVALDPSFSVAWARLAIARAGALWMGVYPRGERDEPARKAQQEAERALQLAPNEPIVTLARGFVLYHVDRDLESAADVFAEVAEQRPGDVDALMALGAIQRRLGDYAVSLDAFDRAVDLQPGDPRLLDEAARTHLAARNLARAAELLDAAIALSPDAPVLAIDRAYVAVKATGDLELARSYLEHAGDPPGVLEVVRYQRDLDAYLEELDAIEPPPAVPDRGVWLAYKSWALREAGRALAAAPLLKEALEVADILEQRGEERGPVIRVAALAMLGREEEAVALAEQLPERIGSGETGDHFWGGVVGDFKAWGLTLAGAQERAIDVLEHQLSVPYMFPLTEWDLRLDPHWDPLREHPRFQALVGS